MSCHKAQATWGGKKKKRGKRAKNITKEVRTHAAVTSMANK